MVSKEKIVPIFHSCGCKVVHVVLFFNFYLNSISAECLSKISQHVSSSETTSQYHPLDFKNKLRRVSLSICFGIITGLVCAILFALLVKRFVNYINRSPILEGPVVFSPKIPSEILKSALANEPQLLGSSANGKYYKVVLDNGLIVSVKRLEHFGDRSPDVKNRVVKKKIQQELEVLAGLRHRNLMSLRAYIHESDEYSLVYDYVPNGSLEDVMRKVRENQLQLKWEVRLSIAIGIVKGLHYLHFTCNPKRLHYNLKPSNVILDLEFNPRLADCGLASIISNFCRAPSAYNAPESVQYCRYTEKSEVFSFGVILGVLLTGKDPFDPFFGESVGGGGLCQWIRCLQQTGDAREALDISLLGEETEENEMLMATRIAVSCLSDLPADRPSSDELVWMLSRLNSF